MLESGSLTPENQLRLKRYIGEAKFARAYYYYWLMDHYCQAYSSDKGDQEGLGLSIVERFNPTGDTSSYPGRSSMNDVLSLIDSDLTAALDALTEYENAGNKRKFIKYGYTVRLTFNRSRVRVYKERIIPYIFQCIRHQHIGGRYIVNRRRICPPIIISLA